MRFYQYLTSPTELIISKKAKRQNLERFYVILQILIFSIPLACIVGFVIEGKLGFSSTVIITFCILVVFFTLFFLKQFQNEKAHFEKNNEVLLLNAKSIGKLNEIKAVIINGYINADAITNLKNIEIELEKSIVVIFKGVNEQDSYEIAELLKDYLGFTALPVISKLY